nr:cation acetate symporter [Microcella alkalica]
MSIGAIVAVVVITAIIGIWGLRISRTTSDFFVASRTVRPVWNASAISGEYLSAGTFLGLSGLVLLSGSDAFWFPIGYAAGYLLVLMLVAAPLRRSGAYTIPDFIHARLDSLIARRLTSALVLIIGWLYIVPQLHGASLALTVVADIPPWVGATTVALVVGGSVAAGGMRSITFVQAFLFWLKFAALAVPAIFFVITLSGVEPEIDPALVFPPDLGPAGLDPYATTSLLIGLLLGTVGLPHVLVRFYTSPTGSSARWTTVGVIVLISAFYIASSTIGLVARIAAPDLATPGVADTVALQLPSRLVPGPVGDLLTALVIAGALAAFLGTSSGLVVSLSSAVSQDLFHGTVSSFRWAAVICTLVPLAVALATAPQGLVTSVGTVFVFAASSLSPVILLGIWWRRLTARGAIAGMIVGAGLCAASLIASTVIGSSAGVPSTILAQPGIWTISAATLTSVIVSLADGRTPVSTDRILSRLHSPERSRGEIPAGG